MANIIHFPITVGRADRVEPKYAPAGVLATCQNLRVRKDGRLVSRTGYQALAMTTPASALFAYDLVELNGRLLAFGTSTSDGYATDVWEYLNGAVGQSGGAWRQGDPQAPRTPLGPFTNMRQLSGIPHPEGGVASMDAAAGGGYVCLIYKTSTGTSFNTLVVRQNDDQTILFQRGGNGGLSQYTQARVIFTNGKFYLMGTTSGNAVTILQYTPGVSSDWSAYVTVDGASANAVTAFDLVAIQQATTGVLAAAFDRGTSSNLEIKSYNSAGAQVGTGVSLAGTNTSFIALEADQTINQIVMLSLDTATLNLRTFNFAGTLVAGPTATTAGSSGALVRVRNSAFSAPVSVLVNNFTQGVTQQSFNPATHAVNFTATVSNVRLQSRVIDSSSPGSATIDTVSFAGYIGPFLANSSTVDITNALFTLSRSGGYQHVRRDYLKAKPTSVPVGLSIDTSNNRVLWTAGVDDLSGLTMPSLALLDYKSTDRRQTCKFGNLLYISGATPLVYDSRITVEPGFDAPGIISITPSNGAGALTPLATYTYQVHFEFTLSDGSIIVGPPSDVKTVTMGAADDTTTVVVQTPHCIPVSLGGSIYGADVTAVLSRNVWNSITSAPFSVERRSTTMSVPTGASNYGATLSITDLTSDATLASNAPIYTQADRGALSGPLEHDLPQAHSYTVATEDRILNAGLLKPSSTQVSKESLIGEIVFFVDFSAFFNQVTTSIKGVNFLDSTKLIFTTDQLYALDGVGPDDLGGGGFNEPREIPTSGGLKSWKSFLKTQDGLFFQLDDNKLFILPRGAESPNWIGKDIEELLVLYPDITGACINRKDNSNCFAAQNTAATDGQFVIRDVRTGLWTTDTIPTQTSKGVESMVNFGRTMAYTSGGTVYAQSETGYTDNTASVITTKWKTHPLYPFQLNGYGIINEIMINGEYRSAGTLSLNVSYDDGVSFVAYTSFALTGLNVGATVERKWSLAVSDITSVVFEWIFVPSTPGEGFILTGASIMCQPVAGQLKELDPGEQA